LVPTCVAVTVASGTAAPCGSSTLPLICPENFWAGALNEKSRTTQEIIKQPRNLKAEREFRRAFTNPICIQFLQFASDMKHNSALQLVGLRIIPKEQNYKALIVG
jgi:hypothetical protein